jgi:hypothetical protein
MMMMIIIIIIIIIHFQGIIFVGPTSRRVLFFCNFGVLLHFVLNPTTYVP